MQCPIEISEVLLRILTSGLLRIRACGWDSDPKRCAIEADHLHNLPALIASFSQELLEFYWDVERTSFIGQSTPEELAMFVPLWERLAEVMARTPEMAGKRG